MKMLCLLLVLVSTVCFAQNNAKLFYGSMPFRPTTMIINPDKDLVEGITGIPTFGYWIGDVQYIDRCGVNAFKLDKSGLIFYWWGEDFLPADDKRHGFTVFAHINTTPNGKIQPIVGDWDYTGYRVWRLYIDSNYMLCFEVFDQLNNESAVIQSITPLSIGWQTVAVTWDGTFGNRAFCDNHCRLSFNGQELASYTKESKFETTFSPDSDLTVGFITRDSLPCNWFIGEIAYIGICEFAVNGGMISQLWQLQSLWEGYCE